jgi:Ribbon-helix-helix protein, copG family
MAQKPTISTPAKVFKTSVNLPQDAVTALQEIAAQRGTTMAEIIRKAISTEKFLHETQAQGGKVLIQDKDKNLKQLLIR